LELLDILPNFSILVLEASKFGPSFILSILGVELLLEFPLEFFSSGDRGRPSVDIVTPRTPPNKGNVLKRKGSIAYLLCFVHDAYCSKVGFEFPEKVVDLPCVPHPTIDRRLECITFRGGGFLS